MPLKIEQIKKEAMQLSSTERAQLAENLLKSLDNEEDPDAERLWVAEAEARYQEYKEGKVKTKPSEQVFKDTRSRLK